MIRSFMDNWLRWMIITIVGGGAVAIFSYYYLRDQPAANQCPPPSVELITDEKFADYLKDAKSIKATGYVLHNITPDYIHGRILNEPDFNAKLVMIDPLGKSICQREDDEGGQSNYNTLRSKIYDFWQKNSDQITARNPRLQVSTIDVYPTMNVIIINDNDLYVHFYSYKDLGTKSPILRFSNYKSDTRAAFFENHLNNIFEDKTKLRRLVTGQDFQRYEEASHNNPCPKKSAVK